MYWKSAHRNFCKKSGVIFCCVRSGKGDGDEAFATGNGSIGLTADFFGNRVTAAESPRRFLLQNCPSQSARYASDCGTLRFQTTENQGHTMLNNIYNTLTNKPLRQHPRFFRRKQRIGGALWSLLRCFEWLNSNSSVGVEAWSTMGKLLYIVFICCCRFVLEWQIYYFFRSMFVLSPRFFSEPRGRKIANYSYLCSVKWNRRALWISKVSFLVVGVAEASGRQ